MQKSREVDKPVALHEWKLLLVGICAALARNPVSLSSNEKLDRYFWAFWVNGLNMSVVMFWNLKTEIIPLKGAHKGGQLRKMGVFFGHYVRDNRCFCSAVAGAPLCWSPMWKWGRPKRFCSLQMASLHLSEGYQFGELLIKVHLLKETLLPPSSLLFPHFCSYLESLPGFSLRSCLEQRQAVSQCPSGSSLPPSGQRGGLKIPTKHSKIYFCAIKRLQSKQISLLLGTCDAHHIPPLATSRAAACHGGLFYTKPNGFHPLWCPVGNGPSHLIHVRSIQPLKHLAWFALKCHQNILN